MLNDSGKHLEKIMTKDEIEFTKSWWTRCLNDENKLSAWLQKLQNTELSGYSDYNNFAVKNINTMSSVMMKSLNFIAEDELKHSNLIIQLMDSRGINVKPAEECRSTFWDSMNANIVSVETFCAVNYYGEALAADRFQVILGMNETPSDIKELLRIVLPDEQFHRNALKKYAGEEALEVIKVHYDLALANLKIAK